MLLRLIVASATVLSMRKRKKAPATVVMRRPARITSTPIDDDTAVLIGNLGKSVSRYDANCNVRQLQLNIQDVMASKREYGLILSRSTHPTEQLYLTEQMEAMTNEIEELEAEKRKLARISEKYN
jgi:hypothetical protein